MENIKLSIPFILNGKMNDKVSEFNVHFNKEKNSFEKFLQFIDMYKDKRINVTFYGDFPMGVATSIDKVSDNTYVRLTNENFYMSKELQEKGIKFFFDSSFPAYNLSSLDSLINAGATDIYPTDDLLYNLEETYQYCKDNNVGMRLVLNTIPSTVMDRGEIYKSQIYRPQDREFLDQYFDAYEFACGRPYDWAKFDVLYRAWFVREGWNGDLSEINDDLELPFPNLGVMLDLTKDKAKCGRRCNKRSSSKCDKCNEYVSIGISLADKGAYLRENKRRESKIGQN